MCLHIRCSITAGASLLKGEFDVLFQLFRICRMNSIICLFLTVFFILPLHHHLQGFTERITPFYCCCWVHSRYCVSFHYYYYYCRALNSVTSRTLLVCHGRQRNMLSLSSSVMTRARHLPVNQVSAFFLYVKF